MSMVGWVLVIVGALVNFLAKPCFEKFAKEGEIQTQNLYTIKILAMLVVIAGAILIFMAGGRING